MAGEARPDVRVVLAYLEDAEHELNAVERLLEPPPNRLAAFHLQQAAEKIVKAIRLARGLPASKEHRLEILLSELPVEDEWRVRLEPFVDLGAYSTAYRYPTSTGIRKGGPSAESIRDRADQLAALLTLARQGIAAGKIKIGGSP